MRAVLWRAAPSLLRALRLRRGGPPPTPTGTPVTLARTDLTLASTTLTLASTNG